MRVTGIKGFANREAVADGIKCFDSEGGPQVACGLQNPALPRIGDDETVMVRHAFIFVAADTSLAKIR